MNTYHLARAIFTITSEPYRVQFYWPEFSYDKQYGFFCGFPTQLRIANQSNNNYFAIGFKLLGFGAAMEYNKKENEKVNNVV